MSLMERLKQETADHHRQIENNSYARGIMSSSLTLEQYTDYLKKFYGFFKPLEERASLLPNDIRCGLDLQDRAKTPLLHQDLLHLGLTQEEIEELPLCPELPDLSSAGRFAGCFYVTEGSTLGGQFITQQIKKFLPVEEQAGLRYFNAYGTDTRARWAAYKQLMESEVQDDEEQDAVASANRTFVILGTWLTQA